MPRDPANSLLTTLAVAAVGATMVPAWIIAIKEFSPLVVGFAALGSLCSWGLMVALRRRHLALAGLLLIGVASAPTDFAYVGNLLCLILALYLLTRSFWNLLAKPQRVISGRVDRPTRSNV